MPVCINMKMPSCCKKCRFYFPDVCMAGDVTRTVLYEDEVDRDCPLIEMVGFVGVVLQENIEKLENNNAGLTS